MAGGRLVLAARGRLQSGRKPTVGQVRRIVKGAIKSSIETNVLFLGGSGTAVSTTPQFVELTLIGQGDAKDERSGVKLRLTSLNLRMTLQGSDTTNLIRIMIVRGYKALVAGDGPASFAGDFDRDDGLVLFDRLYPTDATAGPNAWMENLHLFPKGDVFYDGSGTSAVRGGLYLFFVSDSGAAAHPVLSFTGNLYFKDA